jgi:hypothetical protein
MTLKNFHQIDNHVLSHHVLDNQMRSIVRLFELNFFFFFYSDLRFDAIILINTILRRHFIHITACFVDNELHIIDFDSDTTAYQIHRDDNYLILQLHDITQIHTASYSVNGISTYNGRIDLANVDNPITFTPKYYLSEITNLQTVMYSISLMFNTPVLTCQIDLLYPVGSLYINTTNSTNPAILFGKGTWVRQTGLLWSTSANDGNTTFNTTASVHFQTLDNPFPAGNLHGYRVYAWRRVG